MKIETHSTRREWGRGIGSAGRVETRTIFTVEMTVGIPFLRWGDGPFVSHPFPYPLSSIDAIKAVVPDTDEACLIPQHRIHLALKWRRMMDADPNLTMAQLARDQHLSRARVTQIMNMLSLPRAIQERLAALQDPKEIAFLTESKLRTVAAGTSAEMQIRRFLEIENAFRLSSTV